MLGKHGGLGVLCSDYYCFSAFQSDGVYRQMEFFYGKQAVRPHFGDRDGRLCDPVDACFPYRLKRTKGKTGGLVPRFIDKKRF